MVVARPYVVVRFPGLGTVLGKYSTLYPAATVDAALESSIVGADGPVYTTLSVINGVPVSALDGLFADVASRYGKEPELLLRDPDHGVAIIRHAMAAHELPSPVLRALAKFQVDFDAVWSRVEHGVFSIRARVLPPVQPENLVAAIREALDDAGLAAEIESRLIEGVELQAWLELEQAMKDARKGAAGLVAAYQGRRLNATA